MIRRLGHRMVRVASVMAGVAVVWGAGGMAAQTPQPASQQAEAALPTGRDVVARFVQEIGGADAIGAITSYRAQGTFELTDQGIQGSLELMAARPARNVVRVTVPGIGEILSGFDGKVGWIINPVSGPSLMTGVALQQAEEEALFDAVLHPPSVTEEVSVVEQTVFNGHTSYKVRVLFASGRERFEYYDVGTGLKVGTEGIQETPQGSLPSTTFLRDYQEFGPLRQATQVIQRTLGIEQVFRFTSFEYDQVPDDAFELPPSVKALIR